MATILVVDDEPALRRLLRTALERAGYGVLEAADGPQALLLARTEEPGLILLDVALPGLSGLEVCRRLRAEPATKRTPVLLISGVLPPNDAAKLAEAGGSGWLMKPFTPATLLERVEALLAARTGSASR
jgi:DNA-binding response OmpR family regulator